MTTIRGIFERAQRREQRLCNKAILVQIEIESIMDLPQSTGRCIAEGQRCGEGTLQCDALRGRQS